MFIHRLAGSKCSEVDGHVTKSMRQLLVSCSRMFNCRSLARRFAEGGDVMFIERCGRGVVVGEETEHDLVAGFDCGSASCLLKDGADPWDSFGVVSWQLTRSCLCPEYHTLTFTHINRLHWLWSSPWRRGAPAWALQHSLKQPLASVDRLVQRPGYSFITVDNGSRLGSRSRLESLELWKVDLRLGVATSDKGYHLSEWKILQKCLL